MECLLKHNLEAAASAALAEAEELVERSAELAGTGAAAPVPGASTGQGGRRRARVIDAAFLTEPLQRPLDMTVVRAGKELELFGVGLGDVRRRSLITAQAGRKAVAIAASFGPLGTLSHNLLGTSFELHDTEARRHATVAFDVKVGLSAAPRRLAVQLDNTPGIVYHNRCPVYDPLTRTYVCEFEIRGAVPSVKNFALVGVPEGSDPRNAHNGEAAAESVIELVKQSSDEFL